jgi:hypothetical protein
VKRQVFQNVRELLTADVVSCFVNIHWTDYYLKSMYIVMIRNVFGTVQPPPHPSHIHQRYVTVSTKSALRAALKNGPVRIIGSGWSWNNGILPTKNGVTVKLVGRFIYAKIRKHTLHVGAGTLLCDVYKELEVRELSLPAMGQCLTYNRSQTFGGVLATDVHYSGFEPFVDAIVRVTIMNHDGTIHHLAQNDPKLPTIVGGCGLTGVIIGARLRLVRRPVYTMSRCWMEARRANVADATSSLIGLYPPNVKSGERIAITYLSSTCLQTTVMERIGFFNDSQPVKSFNPSQENSVLTTFLAQCFFWMSRQFIDQYALVVSYSYIGRKIQSNRPCTALTTTTFTVVDIPHEEVEFHVPVARAVAFARYLDRCAILSNGHYLLTLRYTLASRGHYVSFNFDSFDPEYFSEMRRQFSKLGANLASKYDVRVHPGKGWYVPNDILKNSLPIATDQRFCIGRTP